MNKKNIKTVEFIKDAFLVMSHYLHSYASKKQLKDIHKTLRTLNKEILRISKEIK